MNSVAVEYRCVSVMDNMLSMTDTMSEGSMRMSGSCDEIRKFFVDVRSSITNSSVALLPVMMSGGSSL